MATQKHSAKTPSNNDEKKNSITHHPMKYIPATPPDYKYVHDLYYNLKSKVSDAEEELLSIEYAVQALVMIGICDDVEETARDAIYGLSQTLSDKCKEVRAQLYG